MLQRLKSMTAVREKVTFFRKTHFIWMCLITFGMGLLGYCQYRPEDVPHKMVGWPVNVATQYLCNENQTLLAIIWYAAIAAHAGEAAYAGKLATDLVRANVL